METPIKPSTDSSDQPETPHIPNMETPIKPSTDSSDQPETPHIPNMETPIKPSTDSSDQPETPAALPSKQPLEISTALSSKTSDQLLQKILATHKSDEDQVVDVKPILLTMEKILLHVNEVIHGTHGSTVTLKNRTNLPAFENVMLEAILVDIQAVSGELSCSCSGGENSDAITIKLLETLKHYSWNTKIVLALAGFTVNLGEYWLLLQRGGTKSLANSVAFLRQLPEINRLDTLRDGVGKLIQAIRNLAMCNAKFMMKLHQWYFSQKTSQFSEAKLDIIRAAYWIIDSIVQIASLLGRRSNKGTSLTTETGKTLITRLETEVTQIHELLEYHFKRCKEYIGKEMEGAYKTLLELMQRPGGAGLEAILNRFLGRKVEMEKLRSKNVIFLISDLEISIEEIIILNELYHKTDQYEIIWLPIVDGLYDKKKFLALKAYMKWYTEVPALLEPAVVKYIREFWHFIKNAIAVLLTPEGKVTSHNVLPILWIWGNDIFPYTPEKEKALWHNRYDWRLDFLIDDLIDPELRKWIMEGRLICLYGGGSINWILQFTTAIKVVLARIGVSVELVYVGKNNKKDWTTKVITELHSHNLRIIKSERLFWERLRSMMYLYTKMRQGKTSTLTKDDPFMQEVMTILAYDGSEKGWALFCKGRDVIVRMEGETALNIIWKYGDWESFARRHGFLEGLNIYMEDQKLPHSCVQLKLPFVSSEIPGKAECCECGREMEMYYMYRCCAE